MLLLLALLLLPPVLQLLLVFVMLLLLLLLLPTGFCSFTKNAERVLVVCWLFNHFWCRSLLQCSRSAFPTLDISTPQPQRYFPGCCIAKQNQTMRSADTQVRRYTQSDPNGMTKWSCCHCSSQPCKKKRSSKQFPWPGIEPQTSKTGNNCITILLQSKCVAHTSHSGNSPHFQSKKKRHQPAHYH